VNKLISDVNTQLVKDIRPSHSSTNPPLFSQGVKVEVKAWETCGIRDQISQPFQVRPCQYQSCMFESPTELKKQLLEHIEIPDLGHRCLPIRI